MKKIAVLLNASIKNDARVIKIINTLSSENKIDLFYIEGNKNDKSLFNKNVRLFSFPKPKGFRNTIIKHTFFYNEFNFYKQKVLQNNAKYDFVYANDLPTLKPAIEIKKETSAKVIYDSHEIYIETLNQFFPINSRGIKKIVVQMLLILMRYSGTKAEKHLLTNVDHFITVGDELKKYFFRKYKYNGIKVVMNCPYSKKTKDIKNIKADLSINDKDALFIYQGNLNEGRGLKLLVESFQYVNKNIYLLILGNGVLKKELQELVFKLKLNNKIFFHNEVAHSELLSFTKGADFGINLLEDLNLSKKYAVPNKLFEYIHSELPIISSKMPESINIYEQYNIGKLVENNSKSISKAINTIINENLKEYKSNCQLAALKYSWENQEQTLQSIVK